MRPNYPVVLVEWEDAVNFGNWADLFDAIEFDPANAVDFHCRSVGYLIRDDDECVVLASRASGQFEQVGLVERIPRGMVRSKTVLLPHPG